MKKIFIGAVALFVFWAGAALALDVDVCVAGAGTGGMAAAIQAARMGASVAVVEETDRVGGQITASAVATMDDVGRTRHGIYREFIESVRASYAATGTDTAICLWGSDTIAVEPIEAERILLEMLREAGSETVLTRMSIARAELDGDRLSAVTFVSGATGEETTVRASVFIDATETGELAAVCGAETRLGNGTEDATLQDITYVAVVRRYPEGVPDELVMRAAPPGYVGTAEKFRRVVARDGSRWPGKAPFDIPSHNAYRALPDRSNGARIVGGDGDTWQHITRTCINWANDWPGLGHDVPGLPVRYITDADHRAAAERAAMNETLCFIWYMQSELGMTDWSVDDSQGYGGCFSNSWETADDPLLPSEYAPILRHFPPRPYIREGRRIVGLETLTAADIERDPGRGKHARRFRDSAAVGEYPVDVHGDRRDVTIEHDLGESEASFPGGWSAKLGLFQVPLRCLVPVRVDGLVAAEKNISVSRLVNGATRLHPITMHTGQAAGVLAAEAALSGRAPRDVPAVRVQRVLADAGSYVAVDEFSDVEHSSRFSAGAQWASLSGALSRGELYASRTMFGVYLPIKTAHLVRLLAEAEYQSGDARFAAAASRMPEGAVSRAEFVRIIEETFGTAPLIARDIDIMLERGEAARAVVDLMADR